MPRRRGHFGRVDATGGTGKLKRPAVPVWSDHERSEWAGTFQHNDRVEVEAKMKVGERVMVRVRHLESGTSGWLNSKYLKMDRPAAGAPGPGPAAAPDKPASPATPVMQFDHVIHQPHGEYKNEKIVVWETPARQKRKFMLMPGAAVAVLKRVDGDRYGSPYKMINVRTVDGREGWVPQPNVRKAKDQPAPAKPDKPGKPITWNSAYMLYMQALESYSVAMRQARPEARADIDFQTYLDQRCRTEGYRGWDHYAKRAAEAMGPQRWTQFSRTVSVLMADRLRKLAQELSRRDGK